MTLKHLSQQQSYLASGHRTCQGCALPIIVRTVMRTINAPVIVSCATSCLEVTTTIYPQSSWEMPFIHSAFENASATVSGIDAALKYLKKLKKPTTDYDSTKLVAGRLPTTLLAFGGDGGTYDIGLQSLSGAIERGHDFLYVCLDNEAYMNTGIQRSGATPMYSWTTTSPVGKRQLGKLQARKPLTEIIASHNIPYVAQASPSHILDLAQKVQKAMKYQGPKFINILSPCPLGWKSEPSQSINLARLAVETKFWPLWEQENGELRITVDISEPKRLEEFLELQGRFKHLLRSENKQALEELREAVENQWRKLKSREYKSSRT